MSLVLGSHLAFVDVETTGLEFYHDVWEIGVALGEGPVSVFQVPHSLKNADLKALKLNGYRVRYRDHLVSRMHDLTVRQMLEGRTIVGANPGFDATRLHLRWNAQPWHYRTVDVESMAVSVLDLDKPLGLKGLVDKLTEMGYTIPENDHTVEADVRATREVYRALRTIGRERSS